MKKSLLVARILLPYLGAFTLAMFLACPRSEARPATQSEKDKACYAMGGAVGAMTDARNRGMTEEEMLNRLSSTKMPVRMAIIMGQVTYALYAMTNPDREEVVGAFLKGCLGHHEAM